MSDDLKFCGPQPMLTSQYQQYRRTQIAELRPYVPGEDMREISVSLEDEKAGSPKLGDMIARNPKNHADRWLVAARYFADNFGPADAIPAAEFDAEKLSDSELQECMEEQRKRDAMAARVYAPAAESPSKFSTLSSTEENRG